MVCQACTCQACYSVASAGFAEENQPLPFTHHAANLWVRRAKHTLGWSFRVAVASKLTAQSVRCKRNQENVCVHSFADSECDMHIQVKLPALLMCLCISIGGSIHCHIHVADQAMSMLTEDLRTPSGTKTQRKQLTHTVSIH